MVECRSAHSSRGVSVWCRTLCPILTGHVQRYFHGGVDLCVLRFDEGAGCITGLLKGKIFLQNLPSIVTAHVLGMRECVCI